MTTFSFSRPAKVRKKTGYRCASCAQLSALVIDSRPLVNGSVRRRYNCPLCSLRFSTIEIPLATWTRLGTSLTTLHTQFKQLADAPPETAP